MENETIVITGATGFLGRHMCSRVAAMYPNVRLVRTSGRGDVTENVIALDLTDYTQVSKFISDNQPTTLFHLGGLVDLSRTYTVAKQCIEHNLLATTNLLESIKNQNVKKFIYTSTEEVYGTDLLPYKETDATVPPSPYAVTKLASEHMCRIYAQEYNIPIQVFRIGTMYGPNQPEHRYIAQTIKKAILCEPIPLNSGLKKRDYVYVEDVVDAILTAYKHSDTCMFDMYNIGGGTTMSLKDLVEKIVAITHSTSTLRIGEIPDRISEVNEWLLDTTKMTKTFGWKPTTSIEEGLKKTVAYYLQHT